MAQHPIVILGSGIVGLTLSRCLRATGIASIIYERTPSSPRHNYGITLHEWVYQPLLQVLDLDEHGLPHRTAVDNLYHSGTGQFILMSQRQFWETILPNHSEPTDRNSRSSSENVRTLDGSMS